MEQFSGNENLLYSTLVAYEEDEQNPYADATLGMLGGNPVNFTVESDYDTVYFSVGVPHEPFDNPLPRNLDDAPGFEGFSKDLERAVLKKFHRKTSITLTHATENNIWAIYRAQMPLVVDDTEDDE